MSKKPDRDAVLHAVEGAVEKREKVRAGEAHDLSRIQVTITFPDFCAVVRSKGKDGDGYTTPDPQPAKLQFGLDAALMVLKCIADATSFTGPKMFPLWLTAIRASLEGQTMPVPAEALRALQEIEKELPPVQREPVCMPAKRVGVDQAVITYKRLPRKAAPRRRSR